MREARIFRWHFPLHSAPKLCTYVYTYIYIYTPVYLQMCMLIFPIQKMAQRSFEGKLKIRSAEPTLEWIT